MTAPHADQLIDGYLARLRAASAELPAPTRDDLIADMQSHIAEARARETEETDATILNILDRLGEPQVVVADTRERLDLRPQPAYRPGLVEIAAVVLLPLVWIVGVILLWWSPAWKVRDKIIGTLLVPGGYPALFILGSIVAVSKASTASCPQVVDGSRNLNDAVCTFPAAPEATIMSILSVLAAVVVFLIPLLISLYLVARVRWRSQVQPSLA